MSTLARILPKNIASSGKAFSVSPGSVRDGLVHGFRGRITTFRIYVLPVKLYVAQNGETIKTIDLVQLEYQSEAEWCD